MEVENSIDQKGDKIVIGFPDLGGCAYNLCSATIFIFAWLNFFFFFFSTFLYDCVHTQQASHFHFFFVFAPKRG